MWTEMILRTGGGTGKRGGREVLGQVGGKATNPMDSPHIAGSSPAPCMNYGRGSSGEERYCPGCNSRSRPSPTPGPRVSVGWGTWACALNCPLEMIPG